ncbi:MAG TPA: FG-GAP repeat protein [Vicinamibacterales bacterium]|nr:FG-GAP repeat protein [Vicinamibacterales bacterium]
MRKLTTAVAGTFLGGTIAASVSLAGPAASAGLGSDFNSDGWPDLAIGIPGDKVGGLANAGSVLIMYGSVQDQGVSARRTQVLHQNVAGVLDTAEAGDRFGTSVATGDFNGDGYHDLAVGIPGEDTNAGVDTGAFQTFMGSASGLAPTNGLIDAGYSALPGARMGTAMAAVDMLNSFTGNDGPDGKTDVAVGAPGHDQSRGRVLILSGGYLATNADGLELRSYDPDQAGAQAGAALAGGNFDNTFGTGDELAIGEPGFDIVGPPAVQDAGRVMVFYNANGDNPEFLFQSQSAIADDSEGGDRFGEVLETADIDAVGSQDLVIGVPHEDIGSKADAGRVIVVLSSTDSGGGFASPAGSYALDEGTAASAGDRFGASVGAADFGGTSAGTDLAVGVPGRTVSGKARAGRVMVWRSQNNILPAAAFKTFTQDTANIGDIVEMGDEFGSTLHAAHLDAYVGADVIVGVPNEDIGSSTNAGLVHFIYSLSDGFLTGTRSKVYRQGVGGIPGQPKSNEQFGTSLALH